MFVVKTNIHTYKCFHHIFIYIFRFGWPHKTDKILFCAISPPLSIARILNYIDSIYKKIGRPAEYCMETVNNFYVCLMFGLVLFNFLVLGE